MRLAKRWDERVFWHVVVALVFGCAFGIWSCIGLAWVFANAPVIPTLLWYAFPTSVLSFVGVGMLWVRYWVRPGVVVR